MLTEEKPTEAQAGDLTFDNQLRFVERVLDNAHGLNRSIDVKANFLITAVGILTTAIGILAAGALGVKPAADWTAFLRGAGIVLILLYLMTAFSVVYPATQVFKAISKPIHPDTGAPGMLFPMMLLSRYQEKGGPSENAYLAGLGRVTRQELLHDYANQIVEVSNVYDYKQRQINSSIRRFQVLSVLWVITAMLLVCIIVLLPRA